MKTPCSTSLVRQPGAGRPHGPGRAAAKPRGWFGPGLAAVIFCALLPLLLPGCAVQGKEPSANLQLARQLNQAFVEVAENVTPTVVVINVQKAASPAAAEGDDPFETIPWEFRRYFRRQMEPIPEQGEGSGVIIRKDGYILTNRHVVEGAETIEVRLKDGRRFQGKIRGVDPQSDVAVVKIEATGLPVATLADSTRTRVGEFAIAIGAPFALDYSVTFGHVSAKGRQNVILGLEGVAMDQDFIQTDANINPGNSGGPLVNIEGEVIGINTLIRGLRTGIGFAIPSSLAREVSDRLIAEGKFTRAWLGVEIRALRDDQERGSRLKGVKEGVVVRRIVPDGPASKSDLRANDIITEVEGRRVSTPQELRTEIRGRKIGQPLTLSVYRQGKALEVKVSPGEWTEPEFLARTEAPPRTESALTGLGLTVHPLTRELARRFGVGQTNGVMVIAVERGTSADRKGIRPGDVITSINQEPVANPKQFQDAISRADLQRGVVINLLSGKAARFEILKETEE